MEVKFFGGFVYVKTASGLLVRSPAEAGERFSHEGEIEVPWDSPEEIEEEKGIGRRNARFPSVDNHGRFARDYGVTQGRVGVFGWVTRKPGAE